jgi:hypothetical protein
LWKAFSLSCISRACAFRAGDDASIFYVGPRVKHNEIFFDEEDFKSSQSWLTTAARIAVQEEGESPQVLGEAV